MQVVVHGPWGVHCRHWKGQCRHNRCLNWSLLPSYWPSMYLLSWVPSCVSCCRCFGWNTYWNCKVIKAVFFVWSWRGTTSSVEESVFWWSCRMWSEVHSCCVDVQTFGAWIVLIVYTAWLRGLWFRVMGWGAVGTAYLVIVGGSSSSWVAGWGVGFQVFQTFLHGAEHVWRACWWHQVVIVMGMCGMLMALMHRWLGNAVGLWDCVVCL